MGMKRGDCGTAGQLLYTAFSPTMYHFQQRRREVQEQQPGTSTLCLSAHIFMSVIPNLPVLFLGTKENKPFGYFCPYTVHRNTGELSTSIPPLCHFRTQRITV